MSPQKEEEYIYEQEMLRSLSKKDHCETCNDDGWTYGEGLKGEPIQVQCPDCY